MKRWILRIAVLALGVAITVGVVQWVTGQLEDKTSLHATVVVEFDKESGLVSYVAKLDPGETLRSGFKLGMLGYPSRPEKSLIGFDNASWLESTLAANVKSDSYLQAVEFKLDSNSLEFGRVSKFFPK